MEKAVSSVRWLFTACFGIVVFSFYLLLAQPASATTSEYQKCPVNSSCTVGEFLYNDDSTPLTGAACTYTARKPDGTLFINAASMTGASDAWYSYDINTSGAVQGLYRGTICCTPPGESVACIERSFEVGPAALTSQDVENAVLDATRSDHATPGSIGENLQNPSSLSASDIWSYPSRSLTSFGTLVSDIWGNSSRSLSGFGDLVSSIWGNSSRSLTTNSIGDNKYLMLTDTPLSVSTSTTNNSQTTITYNTLTQQLAETKTLLEKIVNQPFVETFVEDQPTDSLDSKLQNTEQLLLSLQDHVTRASNTTDILLLTWKSVDPNKISDGLDSTIQLLGKDVETPHPETILDETQRVSAMWNNYALASTVDQSKAALVSAIKTKSDLKLGGKSNSTRQSLEETSKFISMLHTLVGTEEDTYTKPTAFGFLRDVQKKAEALNQQNKTINSLLSDWTGSTETQRDQLLATVSKEVTAVNAIPSAQLITTPIKEAKTVEIRQKNTTYGLKALIAANERLLAKSPNGLVNLVWLEEGSIVFRFLATNPSTDISQQIKISYTLPLETERENILNYDPILSMKYNPASSAYILEGTVTLKPNESKTFAVEVEDIWKIPEEQLDTLQKVADGLYDNVKKTQFNVQATALKKNIDESIATVRDNQDGNKSAEDRMRAYRQNQLTLVEIRQDTASLGALSTSSAATATPFGFVGGVQVIVIWGMIIILMAGFIYLALYTHAVRLKVKQDKTSSGGKKETLHNNVPLWKRLVFVLFLSTMATSVTASFGSALLAKQGLDKARSSASSQYPTVLGTSVEAPKKSVLLGSKAPVTVYSSPDETSPIYHKIPEDIYVITKAKSKNWIQIQYTWGGLVYIGWVQDAQLEPFQE